MANVLTQRQPETLGSGGSETCETGLSQLFGQCTPAQAQEFYAPERRSFRIHGHSTTIRLEQAFWETLEIIAALCCRWDHPI